MYATPEEANQNWWCPQTRIVVATPDGTTPSFNIVIKSFGMAGSPAMIPDGSTCNGNRCGHWRWKPEWDAGVDGVAGSARLIASRIGYCGLAGEPIDHIPPPIPPAAPEAANDTKGPVLQ